MPVTLLEQLLLEAAATAEVNALSVGQSTFLIQRTVKTVNPQHYNILPHSP